MKAYYKRIFTDFVYDAFYEGWLMGVVAANDLGAVSTIEEARFLDRDWDNVSYQDFQSSILFKALGLGDRNAKLREKK
jgi:hypothetical protein